MSFYRRRTPISSMTILSASLCMLKKDKYSYTISWKANGNIMITIDHFLQRWLVWASTFEKSFMLTSSSFGTLSVRIYLETLGTFYFVLLMQLQRSNMDLVNNQLILINNLYEPTTATMTYLFTLNRFEIVHGVNKFENNCLCPKSRWAGHSM